MSGAGAWEYTVNDDGIVAFTLRRPPVNALVFDDWEILPSVLGEVQRTGASVMVVAGEVGGHFCAGNDFREFQLDVEAADRGTRVVYEGLRAFAECSLLSVAAVEGAALGSGFMLASLCDVRVCAANALFGLPELRVGPFAGYSVARTVLPVGTARRLALGGEYLAARRAEELGFVEAVLPTGEETRDAAQAMVRSWVELADVATLGEVKRLFKVVDGVGIWEGYRAERELAVRLLASRE